MPCKFSNPVKAAVISDFESFSKVPGVVLWALVSEFSWVNDMPRVPGGTERETVRLGWAGSAWLGREPAL